MVILQKNNGEPFLQGRTKLHDNEILMYRGEKSLEVACKCGKLFFESVFENGIFFDSVICSNCDKEMAVIIECDKKEVDTIQ